jgi:hypothetical protein
MFQVAPLPAPVDSPASTLAAAVGSLRLAGGGGPTAGASHPHGDASHQRGSPAAPATAHHLAATPALSVFSPGVNQRNMPHNAKPPAPLPHLSGGAAQHQRPQPTSTALGHLFSF